GSFSRQSLSVAISKRGLSVGERPPNSRGINANFECGSFTTAAVQRLKSDPVTDLTQLLESK
ncbi:hypothetical protein J6590_095434, partial [Homalodisca vitripennis]